MASYSENSSEKLNFLLSLMSKHAYRSKHTDDVNSRIVDSCIGLFEKDYKCSVLDNTNGELCSHYPSRIVLLEYEEKKDGGKRGSIQSLYDTDHLQSLCTKARFARCRTRFVCPVILYKGKHICRSATISGGGEIYGRIGMDMFLTRGESVPEDYVGGTSTTKDGQLFDRIRGQDIRLLKEFSVTQIFDLMLENKKVKYFVNVTSSEKVDKEQRYADFSLWSLPYPGCEFFSDWQAYDYNGESAVFDWAQDYVNAELDFPPGSPVPDVNWQEYKKWSIVKLTQNYMKLLLQYMDTGDAGLLVHCISGWDRTPLFISLLRLSLWADGAIHQSLSPSEILYLTVAYDWYLFGHNLPDRLCKGEEIFFFCFYFLKFIDGDDFCMCSHTKEKSNRKRSTSDMDRDPADILLDNVALAGYYGSSNSLCSLPSECGTTASDPGSLGECPSLFASTSTVEESQFVNGNGLSPLTATSLNSSLNQATIPSFEQEFSSRLRLQPNIGDPSSRSPAQTCARGDIRPHGDNLTSAVVADMVERELLYSGAGTSEAPRVPTAPPLEDDEDEDREECISGEILCSLPAASSLSLSSSNGFTSGSKPVIVPRREAGGADGGEGRERLNSSPLAGSWQIISSLGSFKDSPSSRSSYRSSNCSGNSLSTPSDTSSPGIGISAAGSHSGDRLARVTGHAEKISRERKSHEGARSKEKTRHESDAGVNGDRKCHHSGVGEGVSARREKLERVRSLFYDSYRSVIGFKCRQDAPAGPAAAAASFLGSMAEKIGLKK